MSWNMAQDYARFKERIWLCVAQGFSISFVATGKPDATGATGSC